MQMFSMINKNIKNIKNLVKYTNPTIVNRRKHQPRSGGLGIPVTTHPFPPLHATLHTQLSGPWRLSGIFEIPYPAR